MMKLQLFRVGFVTVFLAILSVIFPSCIIDFCCAYIVYLCFFILTIPTIRIEEIEKGDDKEDGTGED